MAGKTGPTSPEGKAKVSRNALKHGIRASKWLNPDEQRDFETLAADLEAEYQPSTATQRILVERIAMCMSKLRRLHVIEDALFHKARVQDVRNLTDRYTRPSDLRLEEAEAAAMPPFPQVDVLVRYQTTLDRQLSKSIGELMMLKAHALAVLPPADIIQDIGCPKRPPQP